MNKSNDSANLLIFLSVRVAVSRSEEA